MEKRKIEFLAPAGSEDSLIAALNVGADAVYLGLKSFSARKNAANFDENKLSETVKSCHSFGVKVYLTLNTVYFDSERENLIKALKAAEKANVNALIIQDLGIIELLRRENINIPLHASTQMTITSKSGVKMAENLGFKRIVLARELSFSEIKNIRENTEIELEVFVHGALCVSVSGQCYMSAMLGSRSANRGLCAQPCRLNYHVEDRENIISLKDLSILTKIDELSNIGITSVKIEGRMKRPEYVAAAVKAAVDTREGASPDIDTLKAVFSRSGFTDGYFCDNYKNMSGIRTKDDVISSDTVLKRLRQLYKSPVKRFFVDIDITIQDNQQIKCKMSCGDIDVTAIGNFPEKAQNKETDFNAVESQISRLGGTIYEIRDIKININRGLFVSAAELNKLRRECVEKLEEEIIKKTGEL